MIDRIPLATAIRSLPNKTAVVRAVGAFRIEDLDLRVQRAMHPDDVALWRDMPIVGVQNRAEFTHEEILDAAARFESMEDFRFNEPIMFRLIDRQGLSARVKDVVAFTSARNRRLQAASDRRQRLYGGTEAYKQAYSSNNFGPRHLIGRRQHKRT